MTLNTNNCKISLASMVAITNTGATFLLAYAVITSESAESFQFLTAQPTIYVFYDCREPAVIVADFAKGLGAATAGLANHVYAGHAGGRTMDSELPDMDTVSVKREGGGYAGIQLQYCEWHASGAIKRRLIKAGKYNQQTRDELMKLVTDWIRSPPDVIEAGIDLHRIAAEVHLSIDQVKYALKQRRTAPHKS